MFLVDEVFSAKQIIDSQSLKIIFPVLRAYKWNQSNEKSAYAEKFNLIKPKIDLLAMLRPTAVSL